MNQTIKKTGITFGLILATYYILFNVILFWINPMLFTKPAIGLISWAVFILLGILAIYFTKRKLNNAITLKEAFTPFLIMITIGFVINIIVQSVLFNFVDPEAKIEANQILLSKVEETLNISNLEPEDLAEKLQKAKDYDSFGIDTLLFSLVGSILRASIAGLLIALIFRNKSEFTNPVEQKQ